MSALRTRVTPWLLLAPALVLLVAFTHWPALATLWDSARSTAKKGRPAHFIGIDNYRAMLDDDVFWQALWNNVFYALGTIPLSIALAIAMALWVDRKLAGRGFLRLAYFTPTVLPMIAVANIWLFFYTPQYGLLEQITQGLGLASHNWLGDKHTVLGAIIVVAVWKEAGFFMIFYLAALQQIPPQLAEAAALEGASRGAVLPPRPLSAPDADDAVRPHQRADQLGAHGRPPVRDDARRPRQREHAPALLHLPGRLQLLGHGLRGGADRRRAGRPRRVALLQMRLLDRRTHYR